MNTPRRITAFELVTTCTACMKNNYCPLEVKLCCTTLVGLLKHTTVEPHSCVHATRDVVSRCVVEWCKAKRRQWKATCKCCFELCDALDRFCHQRIALPDVVESKLPLLCAFKAGPKIPGTDPYKAARNVEVASCVVYCANTSCSASTTYCHGLPRGCTHYEYPGGLLEYACRCACGDSHIPALPPHDLAKCMKMDFNDCRHRGQYHCHP